MPVDGATLLLGVFAAVVLLLFVWVVATYNRFVRLKHHLRESWADVDVELKRRHDLVPNLVATVKGYAAHEREVLERVTSLRSRAAAPHGSAEAQARDERELALGLKQLFAVVESYPALRSDRAFLALQQELALTEDRIAAARRFYNGNVRDLRNLCEMFPTSLLASAFSVRPPDYFSDAERVVPRVG